MKLLHVSDTHGYLTDLRGDFDVVVHSGDFLPNRTRGVVPVEVAFQTKWILDNAAGIHRWLRARPLLLTHGNHDFIDAVPVLESIGVEAYALDDRRFVFQDVVFYGFPYVPYFTGEWNHECGPRDLEARTQAIDLEGVDVLVAHAPIYGVRDRNEEGERCGSKAMRAFLQDSPHVPHWYLHGHIHESSGHQRWSRNIDVSNAACTQREIDIG